MWYKNICSASFSFVTIHACVRQTDGQTDRQTDRITTPKTALAYARAVKIQLLKTSDLNERNLLITTCTRTAINSKKPTLILLIVTFVFYYVPKTVYHLSYRPTT